MSRDNGFVTVLVEFGRALRAKGLAVGSGDILTYCAAMAPLDPTDLVDLYWAGRTTMVVRREDLPVYDEVFRAFFLASDAPAWISGALIPLDGGSLAVNAGGTLGRGSVSGAW